MTVTSDHRQGKHEAIFDFHPVTGGSFEVFYSDRTLESFGWSSAGWYWWVRRGSFAPDCPAHGPFNSQYAAYRNAFIAIAASA